MSQSHKVMSLYIDGEVYSVLRLYLLCYSNYLNETGQPQSKFKTIHRPIAIIVHKVSKLSVYYKIPIHELK